MNSFPQGATVAGAGLPLLKAANAAALEASTAALRGGAALPLRRVHWCSRGGASQSFNRRAVSLRRRWPGWAVVGYAAIFDRSLA